MYKKKRKTKFLITALLTALLLSGNAPAVHAEETEGTEPATVSAPVTFKRPDDPYNDALWAYDNTGYFTHYYGTFPVTRYSTPDIDINLWEAWEAYPLAKEETRTVVIAIIDTGVDYLHPDLKDQMWTNPNEIPDNGIDDDGNGYIDDIHGWDFFNNDATICHYAETASGYTADPDDNDNHGTHIAGIIAATANNGIGISGVASNVNVQIMSLKIHGGTSSSGSVSNAIKAIQYAEAMGADICNLSWGTTNYNQSLELTIRESSMLFVTAAGNNGLNNNSTPVFPASLRLPNLISVSYINNDGCLNDSSNYGVSTVDIAAPGEEIFSTLVGTYGYSSGSSMAAPHITGLAAMLYAYHDNIYPAQVKELLINTMTPLHTLDGYLINPGIPNAEAAIRCLSDITADTLQPFLLLETTYEKENICVHVDPYDVGGSGVRKVRYVYGSRPADYFSGNNGNALLDNVLLLTKAGYYTFYVEDYAGNYQLYNTYIEDDTLAPDFSASYLVAPDYSGITVHFSAVDAGSGVKSIKYLLGEHNKDAFIFSGEPLSDEQQSLCIPSDATAVTFYLSDYRGNSTTYVVYPEIIPATSVHLNVSSRSLNPSETFQLQPLIFPWLSTDGVSYTSTDTSILNVDANGLVTAVGTGEAYIHVTAYSGVSSACKIIVTNPYPEVPGGENPESGTTGTASADAFIL